MKLGVKSFCLWLVLFLITGGQLSAQNAVYPSPQGVVTDLTGALEQDDKSRITQLIEELKEKTSAEVAVAVVPTTQPETIETYAVKLFERWGIGQKGKDNGVLFLIAINDRSLRIETGYGLEGALPDAVCSQIINQIIVPEFKAGRVSVGISKGVAAIVSLVAKEYNVAVSGAEAAAVPQPAPESGFDGLVTLVFILLILGFFILQFLNPFSGFGGRGYWTGTGGGFGGGFGGGSGGGFGGFGGGFSGGGGASGRW